MPDRISGERHRWSRSRDDQRYKILAAVAAGRRRAAIPGNERPGAFEIVILDFTSIAQRGAATLFFLHHLSLMALALRDMRRDARLACRIGTRSACGPTG